jgi:putative inorganic carbon (HCO3(-)) transporter
VEQEQTSKAAVTRSRRREPLGFAYVGLILFMVVYFARPEDWIPGLSAVPLAKITGILMLSALTFSLGQIRWNMPKEILFLTLLIAQLWLAAVLSSVWKGGAVNVMLDFSKVLPFVIVICTAVRSLNRLRTILFVQAASTALIAIASIVNRHAPGGRLQGALSGIYGNSNDLALAIDISLPLCLVLALSTTSYWKKLAWTVAMLAMIYAVVLTASRGGAIALILAALMCLWQLGVKSRRFYLLLLIPVSATVFWLYGGDTLRERFEHTDIDATPTNRGTEASGSSEMRKDLLFKSLEVTAQHPLFGIGPGNFSVVSGIWQVSHNAYTQISAEGGIPALLFYVFTLWCGIANLRNVTRLQKRNKEIRMLSMALQASLAAYLVGSFFGSVAYHLYPYCLIAYTSSLQLIAKKDRTVSHLPWKAQPVPPETEAIAWS